MIIERESRVFLEVAATDLLTDTAITTFQIALTEGWKRPEDWVSPVTHDGKKGIFLESLGPGVYQVWVKYSDGIETIVMPTTDDLGNFEKVTVR